MKERVGFMDNFTVSSRFFICPQFWQNCGPVTPVWACLSLNVCIVVNVSQRNNAFEVVFGHFLERNLKKIVKKCKRMGRLKSTVRIKYHELMLDPLEDDHHAVTIGNSLKNNT